MSLRYLLRRLGYTAVMLFIVITFNFILFRLMPGDPLAMLSKEIVSDPVARAGIEKMYGLDKPLPIQYLNYCQSMLTLDFGESFQYREPVWNIIKDKIKNSLILGLAAVPIGIALGLFFGVIAAAKRGKKADIAITSSTMIIYAVPTFWLAMIFLFVFGLHLKLVPFTGMVQQGYTHPSTWAYLKDLSWHLITPAVSYMLSIYGTYFLVMRSSMIDVFTEDYVLTAKAKGLTDRQVRNRHVVPNALLPVSTVCVMSLALMFTGAFSIEVLFTWPGMGRLMVDSVTRQDYPVLQASNYLVALAIIAANLLLDVLYSYLDPRVKAE